MSDFEKYIPLDKSWAIRMGVLDLINGKDRIIKILSHEKNLNDDLQSLLEVSNIWKTSKEINVGESGTLFRFLQFVSWKFNLNKRFIKNKTLLTRDICNNPEIVNWSQKELLTLDNETSQWASAAVLCGDRERLENPPFKLKVTYEAVERWGDTWKVRRDETISEQVKFFTGESDNFIPQQAEDYCFARAFDLMSSKEGKTIWPSLLGHESNRIEEMEVALGQYKNSRIVTSKDHRVVQAIAMLSKSEGKKVDFENPNAVAKSWPLFWEFLGTREGSN